MRYLGQIRYICEHFSGGKRHCSVDLSFNFVIVLISVNTLTAYSIKEQDRIVLYSTGDSVMNGLYF